MKYLFSLVHGTIRRSTSACGIALAAATFLIGCREEKRAGVTAPLVEAGGSLYVAKLIEWQAAGVRPLAEVRDRIAHKLREQQRVASEGRFYAEQNADLNLATNQAALEAVPLRAPAVAKAPGTPPSLPSN